MYVLSSVFYYVPPPPIATHTAALFPHPPLFRSAQRSLPTLSLGAEGRHVVIEHGNARLLSGAPHPDAAAFQALHRRLSRFAAVLAPKLLETPPRIERPDCRERAGLAKPGLPIRRLGAADARESLRVLPANAPNRQSAV